MKAGVGMVPWNTVGTYGIDRDFYVQNVFLNAGKNWEIKGAEGMKLGFFTNLIWNPATEDVNFVGASRSECSATGGGRTIVSLSRDDPGNGVSCCRAGGSMRRFAPREREEVESSGEYFLTRRHAFGGRPGYDKRHERLRRAIS